MAGAPASARVRTTSLPWRPEVMFLTVETL